MVQFDRFVHEVSIVKPDVGNNSSRENLEGFLEEAAFELYSLDLRE